MELKDLEIKYNEDHDEWHGWANVLDKTSIYACGKSQQEVIDKLKERQAKESLFHQSSPLSRLNDLCANNGRKLYGGNIQHAIMAINEWIQETDSKMKI